MGCLMPNLLVYDLQVNSLLVNIPVYQEILRAQQKKVGDDTYQLKKKKGGGVTV